MFFIFLAFSAAVFINGATDAANAEFRNAVWGLYEAPAREKLWSGGFMNPAENSMTLVDYGQVKVTNGQQGSRSNSTRLYTIPGEPCRAPAGESVAVCMIKHSF